MNVPIHEARRQVSAITVSVRVVSSFLSLTFAQKHIQHQVLVSRLQDIACTTSGHCLSNNLICSAVASQFLRHCKEWTKIKLRCSLHLIMLTVCCKLKGQIQHCSRVAAVHDARELDSLGHFSNQGGKQVIVTNLANLLVIQRHQGLIVSVLCNFKRKS